MNQSCSIIISNYKRLEYFKRTLYSIVNNYWEVPYELVIAEEISDQTEDILKELSRYNKILNWTCVCYDMNEVTKKTGLVKFFNNPSYGNNLAFLHTKNNLIFHQGNDIIASKICYHLMLRDYYWANNDVLLYSTTINMPQYVLSKIGQYGELLDETHQSMCYEVFQSPYKHSMVTNYLSLCHRDSWIALNGYNIIYLLGVACEDSQFSLSFRNILKSQHKYSNAISYHQDHSDLKPNIDKWDKGVAINRNHYHNVNFNEPCLRGLNESIYGVKEIIKNVVK